MRRGSLQASRASGPSLPGLPAPCLEGFFVMIMTMVSSRDAMAASSEKWDLVPCPRAADASLLRCASVCAAVSSLLLCASFLISDSSHPRCGFLLMGDSLHLRAALFAADSSLLRCAFLLLMGDSFHLRAALFAADSSLLRCAFLSLLNSYSMMGDSSLLA